MHVMCVINLLNLYFKYTKLKIGDIFRHKVRETLGSVPVSSLSLPLKSERLECWVVLDYFDRGVLDADNLDLVLKEKQEKEEIIALLTR